MLVVLPRRDVELLTVLHDCGMPGDFDFQAPNLAVVGDSKFFAFAYLVMSVPPGPPRRIPAPCVTRGVLDQYTIVPETLYSTFSRLSENDVLGRWELPANWLVSFADRPDFYKLVVAFRRGRVYALDEMAEVLGSTSVAFSPTPQYSPHDFVAFPLYMLFVMAMAFRRVGVQDLSRCLQVRVSAPGRFWVLAEANPASFKFVSGGLLKAANEVFAERLAFL